MTGREMFRIASMAVGGALLYIVIVALIVEVLT